VSRERSSAIIRRFALEDEAPLTPLLVERAWGETQLIVKEVKLGAARYILCRNEAEAERERNERQAIIAGLAKQPARGDKALIGNSAYRRYLRRTPSASGKPGPAFEIDPGKLAEEARFDGVFVLGTNTRITPLQAVLRYRDLLQVEDLVPPRQGDPQDPPDLSFQRRRCSSGTTTIATKPQRVWRSRASASGAPSATRRTSCSNGSASKCGYDQRTPLAWVRCHGPRSYTRDTGATAADAPGLENRRALGIARYGEKSGRAGRVAKNCGRPRKLRQFLGFPNGSSVRSQPAALAFYQRAHTHRRLRQRLACG
jgi:hypothetical protein